MHRSAPAVTALAVLGVLGLLAAGCGPGAATNQVLRKASSSPSPSPEPGGSSSASVLPPAPTTPRTAPPAPARPACTNARVVARWPLDRRAAQVLAVPALDFDTAGAMPEVARGAGGVLFLGSAAPPRDLAHRLQALRAHAPRVPPLVMADEEGGGVQRLLGLVAAIPWARSMAATMSVAQTRALARSTGRQMLAAGVTTDLAPVLDVDGRPGPSTSNADGERSFSASPRVAASYGVAFMTGLRDAGVLPVVKHFPGLGGAQQNTDNGPAATRPLSTLRSLDLVPFRAAIRAGAPAVMTSNASVPGLTSLPASLSRAVIGGLLRDELGFRGLVITDSLSAGAVTAVTSSLTDATVRALAAGADLVLYGSTLTPADKSALQESRTLATYQALVAAVVAAVRAHRLPVQRLDAAVLDVLHAKRTDLCS
ncbi:MAG TPA: glycoside hydrolase family 3 N-terminal domain-containing protein [Mycobacteriales bacterium]|nr:glycoside hydrolase family 3 N-terminal domain-containing protein [Mycobacteriales bacterium]